MSTGTTQDPPPTRIERAKAIIATLATRWPSAFFVLGHQRKPLKVGVFDDIVAAIPDIDRKHLRQALGLYCHAHSYLRVLTSGAVRVDLDGAAAGTVIDESAAVAAAHVVKIEAMRAAKAAEHAARASAANRAKQLEANRKAKEAAASKAAPKPLKPSPMPASKPALQLSLTGLREAAQRRRAASEAGRAQTN